MKSNPRRVVESMAGALFEVDDEARIETLTGEVLAFVSAAAFVTRVTLGAALWFLRWAPLFMRMSWRPLDWLARDRRCEVLDRVERSAFGLVLVPWRTLLLLHFYEDTRELASIGYRVERKRHLAVIPVPATSGVRLRGGSSDDLRVEVDGDEKGAA